MTISEDVLIATHGDVGRMTLNRPKAIHALNYNMCDDMLNALQIWRSSDPIKLVLVDHAADTRGFCAGGDIRMLAESGASDGLEAYRFFSTEYRLNAAIKSFPKPYIAIIDGVTMGGGVGISVHGTHRIATENTVFAMPETGIGLFPDVGGSWFLPRLEGELGTWLALTGARLKGKDVVAAGVATHFVPSELIPNLKAQLLNADLSIDANQILETVLDSLSQEAGSGSFSPHLDAINECFAHDKAENIFRALASRRDEWSQQQLKLLKTKSPQTIKVALRQMRDGAMCSNFEDVMRMEYRIARRVVHRHDFLEGVRAVIVDKDNAPSWSPATLEGVSEDMIADIFAPLGDNELAISRST